MSQSAKTPVNEVESPVVQDTPPSRLGRLKTAFLYVLIAGLAAAALTSVVALLIGQFNTSIIKALLTILTFFSHSLLILAILWADRYNQVGKLILPSAIIAIVFASMISTTLGTWEIITAEMAWRIFGLYFLALGAVFIIVGLLRLRIAHQATQVALFTAIGLTVATVLSLIPWVLQVVDKFDPLYFRIVGALAILATTSLLISVVVRSIAVGHNESLKLTAPTKQPVSGGLLAIYIITGVVTAIVWCAGLTGFLVSGVQSATPDSRYETNHYY